MAGGIPLDRAWMEPDEALTQQVVAWRRHLHMHPELSFEEYETTEFIVQQLQSMGIAVERPTPTGVVGLLEGRAGPGPTIALRADIDALPIQEANTFPYRSQRDGVMHACAHDGHTAILLGTAKLLAKNQDRWPGRVKLLFQPAEEVNPGGAQPFIDAGVLEGVSNIIGLHLIGTVPYGTAGIRPGPMLANTGRFEIHIQGKAGHASLPHQNVDAALIAAQLVVNLQAIVSRQIDPAQPAVLTVSKIEAGTTFGLVAGSAHLLGSLGSLGDDWREKMVESVKRIAQHTAALYGAEARVDYYPGIPALVNDPETAAVMAEAAEAVLGPGSVFEQRPVMVGDDFARYCQIVPGAYLFLSAKKPEQEETIPHHHPRFDFDERALPKGVAIMTRAAVRLLTKGEGADDARLASG